MLPAINTAFLLRFISRGLKALHMGTIRSAGCRGTATSLESRHDAKEKHDKMKASLLLLHLAGINNSTVAVAALAICLLRQGER